MSQLEKIHYAAEEVLLSFVTYTHAITDTTKGINRCLRSLDINLKILCDSINALRSEVAEATQQQPKEKQP